MIAALAAASLIAPAFEARMLWVDATANLEWTVQPEKVRDFCAQAKNSGFNELVVDVKPINGKLLFASEPSERFSQFRNITVPENYDLLAEFSRAARATGLRISVGVNVFSEGHSYFPGVGKAYENPSWQTKVAVPVYEAVLESGKRMPIRTDENAKPNENELRISANGEEMPGLKTKVEGVPAGEKIVRVDSHIELVPQTKAFPEMVAVFVEPLEPGVRERILNILKTVARYEIDGIVFDRLRFPALSAGMGPAMKREFEKRYGAVSYWPESVFVPNPEPASPLLHGPRFAEWMQFRTEVITEFLAEARKAIREINPKLSVGSYVGAGWETYYEVGVNFAADTGLRRYPWALEEYGLSGYAGLLDFLAPGVFYKVAREVDPGVVPGRERFTVQGAANLIKSLSGRATFIYPTLYGLDWDKNPEGLRTAIRESRRIGNGVMLFDASYVIENNWWPLFADEFKNAPSTPPHAMPSMRKVRQ